MAKDYDNNEQNYKPGIYEEEYFEKEPDMKKKKGFFYYLINVVLVCAIIAVLALLAFNFYQYFSLKNETVRNLEEAVSKYDEVICDTNSGTVKANYQPNALSKDQFSPNEIIGYIEIPDVDMQRPIAKGDASDGHELALGEGAAWDPYTSLPQTGGYTVFAGHRDYVFADLENVEKGMGIVVNINNQVYTYKVTETKVIADDANEEVFLVGDEATSNKLVLYTCYPFFLLAPITERYVVYAEPVDEIEYSDCSQ